MLDDTKKIFIQESEELLEQMENALLEMEQVPNDAEHLNSVFRAIHTIKGAAGIFGFDAIVAFTHPVESVMDNVRNGLRSVDPDLIALLLKCKDHTANLVEFISGEQEDISETLQEAGKKLLNELTPEQPSELTVTNTNEKIEVSDKRSPSEDHWVISLDFKPDALRNGLDPLSFINYLKRMGEIIEIITFTHDFPCWEDMDPESCYLSFRIALSSSANKEEIKSVFEFALDDCELRIVPPHSELEKYLALLEELTGEELNKLGELLIQVGALTEQELNSALQLQNGVLNDGATKEIKPLGEILVEQHVVSKDVVEKAVAKQEIIREKIAQETQYIRVDANRLGQLINLVGELVISNAAVKLLVEKHDLADVQEVVSGVEGLVENIRDHALQLRMVQIGETFSRFRRVVRDVSKDLNKDVELVITGGEAELDKTVVEKINDPLTHLVRNSLDHGFETPDERVAQGKPRKGVLRLNALHDSGHIVIQIADDGAGLDTDKIRKKAEEKGLINAGQELSQREILRLIFEPGLTTKDTASNISGRGVGMDVVKRNIDALRGTIEVDSERGKGTLVTIHLPLTLAIIEGFMVGVEQERFVIPLSMVEECVEMNTDEWHLDKNSHYVNLRGQVMPYIKLSEFFGVNYQQSHRGRESLVIVKAGRAKAGIVVDRLFGELQTVIKPLGKVFQGLKGVSGATVLGSGEIALILDVQGLIGLASAKTTDVKTLESV
ncbi:chemotaxis protein CheA [Motilimonas sp. 1_MG-2023]|uniref:chemotaxis protein CheA n=1 Tax=Motilimonas sp. 1_MG-2023 TaxID=3062672 RepID=UPI0026E3610F|nr:chemotaxis protein CheA [Motilimonas sp. 1_MG-2023]MDO6526846.1 chemotaxis protein CheA [Motilimonas sp. 1_MG-2023]